MFSNKSKWMIIGIINNYVILKVVKVVFKMIVGDLKRALTREELEVLEKIKKTSQVTPKTFV